MVLNTVINNNSCLVNSICNIKNQKKISIKNNVDVKDSFSKNTQINKGEKVSFKEGISLIGKGFVNKIKSMGRTIIEHPIKTICAVAATTGILSTLPLIGITAATGSAVMAIGFAGYTIGKTAVDITKAVKHNKSGEYNEVRKDLEKIGGDSLDLTLSLPFVPKAINQAKRTVKYGRTALGLNSELITNLKNIKSIKDIPLEFGKAEARINYEIISNEMGLSVKPKLTFRDIPIKNLFEQTGGAFEPVSGELIVNQNLLFGKGKLISKIFGATNNEMILRHELEHFRQFANIARTKNIGIDGLSNALTKYYKGLVQEFSFDEIEKLFGTSTKDTIKRMINGDTNSFNAKLYQDIINNEGTINNQFGCIFIKPTGEQYVKALFEKINPNPENLTQFKKKTKNINPNPKDRSIIEKIKMRMALSELYSSNILEKYAFDEQLYYAKDILLMRPNKIVNGVHALSVVSKQ